MVNQVSTSGTSSAGNVGSTDASDAMRAQEILDEVREYQAEIQAALSGVSPSVQNLVSQQDPGLIGYA